MATHSAETARYLIHENVDTIMANAQALRTESAVSLAELLSAGFMANRTKLASASEMFALAGEQEVSDAALAHVADNTWEEAVQGHTDFDNWSDMFFAASQTYAPGWLLEDCLDD
ncbi:MAG TPA: hypothetical protein DIU07_17235 [Rhodobacteraceae bacterium]|nr:hypothetical protein [Paracoccaceae bacterium]